MTVLCYEIALKYSNLLSVMLGFSRHVVSQLAQTAALGSRTARVM